MAPVKPYKMHLRRNTKQRKQTKVVKRGPSPIAKITRTESPSTQEEPGGE